MKVLITGHNGYVGYPLCIQLLDKTNHTVIGVDNNLRYEMIQRVGGKTQNNIFNAESDRFVDIRGDLSNRDFVNEIIAIHRPDTIIHLASQPSMPYSQINAERAEFTQINNVKMCLNLLWALHQNNLKSRFIITTTTGIPGQEYKTIDEYHSLNAAGSWYHVTRGFDSANCWLASRQWNQPVLEFRTSIVYGIQTSLMKELGLYTRFDVDYYFGTVVNRFIHQAMKDRKITVYGEGNQVKPFISLEDTVVSLANAVDFHKVRYLHQVFNQVTEHCSVLELARMVQNEIETKIVHIDNPRVENEDHRMVFRNRRFFEVLDKQPSRLRNEIPMLIRSLKEMKQKDWSYLDAEKD